MERSRKRENISPEGGFHDVPRYVHPSIYMTEVEGAISLMLLMFSGTCHSIVLTGRLVVIGTSSSCTVLFFGRFGYKKIAVAAHIWHLP